MCNSTCVRPTDCPSAWLSDYFPCLALAFAWASALPCSIVCRLSKCLERLCTMCTGRSRKQVLRLLLAIPLVIPIPLPLAFTIAFAIAFANFRFGSDVSRSNCRSHVVFSCSSCAPLATRTLIAIHWEKYFHSSWMQSKIKVNILYFVLRLSIPFMNWCKTISLSAFANTAGLYL